MRAVAGTLAGALVASTLVAGVTAAAAPAPAAEVTSITVDGDDVRADNVNGLTFKGFGVLSANSTSAVLMDYKAQHPKRYAELLRVLFGGDHPIMRHVKIEMGDDRNNSTGSDVATMRTPDEPANVRRHPGFQLAADAKKVNPDVQVSILRWNAVPWADTNDEVYDWYKNTILAAYRDYGYMVDYVNPGVNEHAADLAWTKEYAERVRTDDTGYVSDDPALAGFRPGEAEKFHDIQVVISDEVGTGTFGDEMVADASLRDAVGAAGFHYNTDDDRQGSFTRLADELDEQIWNSEAQATFSSSSFRPHNNTADPTVEGTGLGGTGSSLEMANTIVKGFVNSRRTHFVYQPAIGSFYEGGQYSYKELVGARDPWSGWMHYDAGLAVLQHFSSFAVTGWENPDNTAGVWRAVPEASGSTATGTNPVVGRDGGPNYLTMAAPDRSDFSTVLVNDSERPRTYRITPEDLDLGTDPSLAVWETRAAEDGEFFAAHYKQHVADLTAGADGAYAVTVAPFSVTTVTSLDVTGDEGLTTPLPVEGERTVLDKNPGRGVLWSDDFDYTRRTVPVVGPGGTLRGREDFVESRGGDTGAIPLYTWDRNGSFEAYLADDGERVLRQQVDREGTGVGGAWNGGDPITAVGDRRWTNYRATVDVRFERGPAADNYAALGARSSGGGSSNSLDGTPYALKLGSAGDWQLLRYGAEIDSGSVAGDGWDPAAWHELSVQVAGDRVTASVDGTEVVAWTDDAPVLSGWVDLASGFHWTQFDDLVVERVADEVPYYGEYLDGMEMTDLAEVPRAKLVYDGDWAHDNGRSMYEYGRTSSVSQGAGASVSYTFTGSGLDVLGPNDGSARLDVSVDGDLVATNARTRKSGHYQQAFELRGLPWGKHTVTLTVASGTLDVDAVGVVSARASRPTDTTELSAALAEAEAVERSDDFTDTDWAVLQRTVADARAAVRHPRPYRLDGQGAAALVSRLATASDPVANRIVDVEDVRAATYAGQAPDLPETLTAELTDGSTREVPVTWSLDDAGFDQAWATVAVTGAYGPVTTTAHVEVVPAGTEAFADVNATAAGALGHDSPSYLAIDGLVGGLVNDAPDQVRAEGAAWGHWAQDASGARDTQYKGIVAGDYDKTTTTGMYTANQVGAEVSYTFTLPAGRHTVVAGSHSWWPGNSRSADVVVTYDGEEHAAGSVTLDRGSPSEVLSSDVDLAAAGPVTITLRATNSQSPMLSWAAAVAHDAEGGNA
ncbi:Ig-like domain-containing protein [Isoptericola sp. BMS4]|uniref:Ig-like domain-containing protein n=1 Tax=Isoptericola sp. BMS4 TaxID=2527875 RepID=UPI001421EFAA|nr:Ig-like domain-containing protein [Isoptericola sp. BMS4]